MFRLTIETGNAAFGEDVTSRCAEIARILRVAAAHVEQGSDRRNLYDFNGNMVGSFRLTGGK